MLLFLLMSSCNPDSILKPLGLNKDKLDMFDDLISKFEAKEKELDVKNPHMREVYQLQIRYKRLANNIITILLKYEESPEQLKDAIRIICKCLNEIKVESFFVLLKVAKGFTKTLNDNTE